MVYIGNNTTGLIAESAAIGNAIGGFVLQTNSTTTIPVKFTGNNELDTVSSTHYGYETTGGIVDYSQNTAPFYWIKWITNNASKWRNVAYVN